MKARHYLAIESGVSPYQVFQRNANGCADISFAGTTTVPDGTPIWGRLLRFGQPVPDFAWTRLAEAGDGAFEGTFANVPAGGEYSIELRAVDPTGLTLCTTACNGILVGDIWVLAGQSNMQGVGLLDSPHVAEPSPLVHAFDMGGRWLTACEPLHWHVQSVDPVHRAVEDGPPDEAAALREHRDRTAGVGPGLPFAMEMACQTGVPVGLIPCAVGGTSMDQWDPAKADQGGRSLYGAMLRRVRAVGGRVTGMLWYQGESDTGAPAAQQFGPKFRQFIGSVRRDLERPDLPFLYVQIGRFVTGDQAYTGWNIVQEAQRQCADQVPSADVVPAVDLELDDGIHLSTAGQARLGRRLATVALRRLFGRADLNVGPRLAQVAVEQPTLVRVCYREVNGSLRTPGAVCGFTIRDGQGRSLALIYRAEVDASAPSTVLLRLDKPVPDGACLWYGYGIHPSCNLTDERDMGAPVFGPLPLKT
jgi:sialate O-acetylesterase